jgi:hypothetical protein
MSRIRLQVAAGLWPSEALAPVEPMAAVELVAVVEVLAGPARPRRPRPALRGLAGPPRLALGEVLAPVELVSVCELVALRAILAAVEPVTLGAILAGPARPPRPRPASASWWRATSWWPSARS